MFTCLLCWLCQLRPECAEGQEGREACVHSSAACQGWVATRHTCYKFVSSDTLLTFDSEELNPFKRASKYCNFLGGSLAAPKRDSELEQLIDLISTSNGTDNTVLGVYWGDMSFANMYRTSVIADDKAVLYSAFWQFQKERLYGQKSCLCISKMPNVLAYQAVWISACEGSRVAKYNSNTQYLVIMTDADAVCEFTKKEHLDTGTKTIPLQSSNTSFLSYEKHLTHCHNGHIVPLFLACGSHSGCGQRHMTPCTFSNVWHSDSSPDSGDGLAPTAVLFSCDGDDTKVSFSFLCDLHADCQDNSDESFCTHPPCVAFTCTSGQCVSFTKRCDRLSDCFDASDESDCAKFDLFVSTYYNIPAPFMVEFDGSRDFILTKLKPDEPCPDSHYRCLGEFNNCLPVYTRCNGVYDCIGHEDEEGCNEMICPGFFRCRKSIICVHRSNLCDGWPHCPLHDDELLCGLICPEVCLCHGHAFLCPQSFSAHLFPNLRYLDATDSGMSPSDLRNNTYLIYLRLASCALTFLSDIKLSNLQVLDLSENKLQHVDMSVFVHSEILQNLSLASNPLSLLHSDPASVTQQSALQTLDLSHTTLTVFDSQPLSPFLSLRNLDLSFTSLHTIGADGFQFIPQLTTLTMKGSSVKTFPPNIFQHLHHLRTISAQNYKLCCSDILPGHFEESFCNAPKDEISSCDDLLQTWTYRVFLWMISCMSVSGNIFCCIIRLCVLKTSLTGFSVFVTNLCIADFLMGVYVTMIGIADQVYQGRYMYYDTMWKSSAVCQVAGFLSLLSSEVSALIIWFITLDRFIVLHFPFSNFQFNRSAAAMACLICWLVGLSLASLPLFPGTLDWEFYSQTGLCIPLPVTRHDFKGRAYSFSVMIVFNFVLFILISSGQVCIYWSVQKNTLTSSSTKASQEMTIARRLITVAVTDFMCWFPIGICGILALAGVSIPGEVNVALAVFVLPLNSALNPFVYTFNTLVEKRRKLNEAKLLKWLESNVDTLEK